MEEETKDMSEECADLELLIKNNNALLETLLQDEKVKMYLTLSRDNEKLKTKLSNMLLKLSRERIMKCKHFFVPTDVAYDRSDKYSEKKVHIYHCLKCGVTNEYEYKEVPKNKLNKLQKQMRELYIETVHNGIHMLDFSSWKVYSLDRARAVYDVITQMNPNITLDELEKIFPVLYSNADKFIERTAPLLKREREEKTLATPDRINDSKKDKTKVKK